MKCGNARHSAERARDLLIEPTYSLRSACHCSAASLEPCPVYTGALDWRRHLRNIVDKVGEIIAKATDDHTLIGGHHRLALAASLGQELFWQDTGEPVKLDVFFRGSH